MKYAMLVCGDMDVWDQRMAQDPEADQEELGSFFEKWGSAGKLIEGGVELRNPSGAKTVRRGPDGKPEVTDGPYLEIKEVVGGVVLLDAEDIDEAVSIAATWPGVATGIATVEVRPVMES